MDMTVTFSLDELWEIRDTLGVASELALNGDWDGAMESHESLEHIIGKLEAQLPEQEVKTDG